MFKNRKTYHYIFYLIVPVTVMPVKALRTILLDSKESYYIFSSRFNSKRSGCLRGFKYVKASRRLLVASLWDSCPIDPALTGGIIFPVGCLSKSPCLLCVC